MIPSLFAAQEEAEDKVLVDGVRLWPSHVEGYRTLRRVLGLSVEEAQELIEQNDSVETIVCQAVTGCLKTARFGQLVNEKLRELAKA